MTWIKLVGHRDLFLALHYCHRQTFPRNVRYSQLPDTTLFYLPEDSLSDLELLAPQHGIHIDTAPTDEARTSQEALLSAVLPLAFQYLDPSAASLPGELRKAWRYDPADTRTEYVLAANDGAQAQAILDALLQGRSELPRAAPLIPTKKTPYEFLWLVGCGAPPLLALQLAARSWWGRRAQQRPWSVFREWPYTLLLPESILERMDWRPTDTQLEGGIVLLGGDDPQRLILAEPKTGRPTVAMLRTTSLTMGRVDVLQQNPSAELKLDVQLSLSDAGRRDSLAEQERRLTLEIDRLQAALSQIREQRAQPLSQGEPLMVYYSRGPHALPYELQHLLLEWSVRPEDLGQLRYTCVDCKALPSALRGHASHAHFLTTRAALEQNGGEATAVGRALQRYVPDRRFELLSEWSKLGLRLFVPSETQVRLEPPLPVNSATERKLREALKLGANATTPVLLFRSRSLESELGALKLERPGAAALPTFTPFEKCYSWTCSLEVVSADSIDESVLQPLQEHMRAALTEGFDDELTELLHASVLDRHRRVSELYAALTAAVLSESDTQRLTERVREARKSYEKLEASLQEILSSATPSAAAAQSSSRQLEAATQALQGELAQQAGRRARLGRRRGSRS